MTVRFKHATILIYGFSRKKSHTNQSTLNIRTHTSTHKQKLALKVTQFWPIQACTDTDTFASFVYDFIIKNKAKAGKPKSSLNLTNTVCKLNAYKSSANFNDPHTQLWIHKRSRSVCVSVCVWMCRRVDKVLYLFVFRFSVHNILLRHRDTREARKRTKNPLPKRNWPTYTQKE